MDYCPSKYAHSLWIHIFHGLFHCWKHQSDSVLGTSYSWSVTLSLIVSSFPNLLPFKVFLIRGNVSLGLPVPAHAIK
jgi:hypothetical protein